MIIISNIIGSSQAQGNQPQVVTDYINRVEAAGGTVVATQCLVKNIINLGWKEFIPTVTNFKTRVTAAGGTVVALQCLEDTIFTLKAN